MIVENKAPLGFSEPETLSEHVISIFVHMYSFNLLTLTVHVFRATKKEGEEIPRSPPLHDSHFSDFMARNYGMRIPLQSHTKANGVADKWAA
jgi:hypothetical protein